MLGETRRAAACTRANWLLRPVMTLGPSPPVLDRWPRRFASRRKNGCKCYAIMVDCCEAPDGYCQVFESRGRITKALCPARRSVLGWLDHRLGDHAEDGH